MKKTMLFALPFAIALSACINADHGSIAKTSTRESIYNGQVTSKDSLISRSTVLIVTINNGALSNCTGSVLSPTVILTAGHCVSDEDETSKILKVYPESNIAIYDAEEISKMHRSFDEKFNGSRLAAVEKVIVHSTYLHQDSDPLYNLTARGYDLALIKLDRALPSTFKPVVLPDDLLELSKNQIRVAGFGFPSNDPNDHNFEFSLRDGPIKIDLSVREIKTANLAAKGTDFSLMTMNTPEAAKIAFQKNADDASICQGDSGGPLYYEKNGEIHLVGVNVSITGRTPCVDNSTSWQISVSLAGRQIYFVLDAYKELTGESLDSSKEAVDQDNRTFESQLSTTTKPKNSIASLEGYSYLIDKEGKVKLVDEELARITCQGIGDSEYIPSLQVSIANSSPQVLDGKTTINILALNKGVLERVLESRMKLTDDGIRTVILTTEGYISADVPALKCQ